MKFKNNIKKMYVYKFFRSMHLIGGILVPFFLTWGGVSYTQMFILQAFFMISVFLLEVPTGVVADYFGRKHSLILAGIFGIAAPLVYASYPNFWIFVAGELLFAISAALLSGADKALIYDSLKRTGKSKKSKKTFARYQSAGFLAIMIGSPLGSLLAAQFGLRVPMLLMAIPVGVSVIIGLTLKEPKTKKKVESYRYWKLFKSGSAYLFKHRTLKILVLDMVVVAVLAHFMIWMFQPMLMKAGIGIAFFGMVHAAMLAAEIGVMNNAERLEKLFGSKRRLLLIGPLLLGLSYIVGGLVSTRWLIIPAILIGGGFALSRRPLFDNYLNKYIPSDKRATVLSTASMFFNLGMALTYPFVGMLTDWNLNYTLIGLGVAVIVFALVSKVEEEMLID